MKTGSGCNSAFSIFNFTFLLALCAAAAGCFDEPTPAYKTVPAEARVYLKGGKLEKLTDEALLKDGRVFVEGSGWTNLSARVKSLDPASLDYLNLDRNALTNVDAVAAFKGLKWLRLNGNRLSSLPSLSELKSLRRIYLADNAFAAVPEQLKDLPELTDVDLSGNPVKEIPAWLAEKKGLKNLSFSRTQIKKLPDNIDAWKSLKSLQLGELSLSPEEMARIRKTLPDVAVVF